MDIIYVNDKTLSQKPCVATIGFFDGVHRGHRSLIEGLVAEAGQENLSSLAITFDEHPRKVLNSDFQPELLTTFEAKLTLLSKTGIDATAVLHFDKALAALTAREFMEKILKEQLNVKKLFIGYDHRFGHGRTESFEDYVRYGRELGIEVVHNKAFVLNGVNLSSSVVRSLLREGEVEMAAQSLGYPYTLQGRVTEGCKIGRSLGYPTANLDMPQMDQLIPEPGVYAVKVRLQDQMSFLHGMMNIGSRPTFGGEKQTLEVHIFHFEGDLYDKEIMVSFFHRIRSERKFPTPEALIRQLEVDAQMVMEQFQKDIENE